jgi:prepilin-type N-terminal cleavage/methylation domain-containing protein
MSHRRGYTLLELILTIAVIAAVGVLVLPRLASGRRGKVEDAARAALGLCRKARALAAAEGRTYVLVVDVEGGALRLARQRDPLAAPTDDERPELEAPQGDEDGEVGPPRWARAVALGEEVTVAGAERGDLLEPEEVDLGEGALEVPFHANGASETTRIVFATLQGADALTLEVDGPLGLARLRSPEETP